MSFIDPISQTTLAPNAGNANDAFNQELNNQTNIAEQELDGGQQPYDAAQANRIVSLLRELSNPATDPEAADAIEAQLAELGIAEARGGTTPQIVAQLMGLDSPEHATEASISAQLTEQNIDLPEGFWRAGLDKNWQALENIIEVHNREATRESLV